MICKNCGKENLDYLDNCIYCKQKLNNEIVKSIQKGPEVKMNEIKNNNKPNSTEKNYNMKSAKRVLIIALVLNLAFWIFIIVFSNIIFGTNTSFDFFCILCMLFGFIFILALAIVLNILDKVLMKKRKKK